MRTVNSLSSEQGLEFLPPRWISYNSVNSEKISNPLYSLVNFWISHPWWVLILQRSYLLRRSLALGVVCKFYCKLLLNQCNMLLVVNICSFIPIAISHQRMTLLEDLMQKTLNWRKNIFDNIKYQNMILKN